MNAPVPSNPIAGAVALALILGSLLAHPAIGQEGEPTRSTSPKKKPWDGLFHKRSPANLGTLGYGAPGLHPGFQGFGLGYHPGYGYGGEARGVGAEGGYPLYGGPGYPHPAPSLRRIGGIAPFCYFGGPGGSPTDRSNFFEGVGPLAPDQPVVDIPPDSPSVGDYGPFTGTIPYPEATFAPYTTREAGDSSGRTPAPRPSPRSQPPTPSPTGAIPSSPDATGLLGIETDAVVEAGSARGLKVNRTRPGGLGGKAGLKVGDLILAANGITTEQPGQLSQVVDNATSGGIINLTVLGAVDGEVRTLTARRP